MVSHFRFLVGSSTRWIDHLRWENPRESSGGGGLLGPWVRWWSTIGYHRYNVYNHQVSAIPCSLWPIFESQSQLGPSQQLSIHIDTKLPTREDEQAVSMVMLAPWPGRLLDRHWLVVQCQCAHLEKWWTSSMGFGWHPIYEMENNPFMFETTKQYTFLWLMEEHSDQGSHVGWPLSCHRCDLCYDHPMSWQSWESPANWDGLFSNTTSRVVCIWNHEKKKVAHTLHIGQLV